MTLQFRNYTDEPGFSDDFHKVRDFLVRLNAKNPIQYNFEWGRWEWAFSLSFLDKENLSKIGIWENDGEIAAVATYETRPGTIYFCLDKTYRQLKTDILLYARDNLRNADGKLKFLINNSDSEFHRIAAKYGFKPTQENEPNSVFDIDLDSMEISLPPGYSIFSLADDFDLKKFHTVLWRGFNHEGDPPMTEKDLAERKFSISGPDFRPETCILVVSPSGEYASYCGMWYDNNTEYAFVEPVATDPKYRKLGLGKVAVLEGIKRCGVLGAKQAYVGSSQQFYYQLGFRPLPAGTFWEIR